MGDWKHRLKAVWHFIWHDNSILSWIVNVLLAFILIKFLVYPGLGLLFQTDYPIVAVVSNSMDHRLTGNTLCGKYVEGYAGGFDGYWEVCGSWYEDIGITQQEFADYPLNDGFNKGDLIILFGKRANNIKRGDIIVFQASQPAIKRDPLIHRIVDIEYRDGVPFFTTKGDHNADIIREPGQKIIGEESIAPDRVFGNAAVRIPLLGFVKIWFVDAVSAAKGVIS